MCGPRHFRTLRFKTMSSNPEALLLRTGWLVERSGLAHRGGGVLFEDGLVREVCTGPHEVDALEHRLGLRAVDASGLVIAPCLVNAHAHLELGALRGRLHPGSDFPGWIRALLVERSACTHQQLQAGMDAAARELLRSGTSLVADIDSLSLPDPSLPIRRRRFVELLDAQDPARSAGMLRRAHGQLLLAPHAPYTLREESLRAIGVLAQSQNARLSIHWAETEEEECYLESHEGPFAALLPRGGSGRGLERLERAGLLGPRTLLVHGNAASEEERGRVAVSGAGLVHCPGTHRWFARRAFDWQAWAQSGVPLALGTDSLASNTCASMRQEIAWLLADQPGLDPWQAHAAATVTAAGLLGEAGRAGCLSRGARADALALEGVPGDAHELARLLCDPRPELHDLWIGGCPWQESR